MGKFDQEKAFQMILNYYRMRKDNPEIFAGLKPSDVSHVYRSSNLGVNYPYRDRLGRTVCFFYPGTACIVIVCILECVRVCVCVCVCTCVLCVCVRV